MSNCHQIGYVRLQLLFYWTHNVHCMFHTLKPNDDLNDNNMNVKRICRYFQLSLTVFKSFTFSAVKNKIPEYSHYHQNTFTASQSCPLSSMLAFYIMHSVINNHHQPKSLFINVLCRRPEPWGSLTESPVHANVISSHLSTSWAPASG